MVNLNKGISTPLAITIIMILAVLVGGGVFAYQYYWMPKGEKETSEIQGIETPTSENNYENIAQKLMQDYLEPYKSQEVSLNEKIKDYSINKIDVEIIKNNCFGFTVNFSVNTYKNQNNNWTDWIAGNGEVDGDWVKNKSIVMNAVKEGNVYKMKIVGTGRGDNDCTTGGAPIF